MEPVTAIANAIATYILPEAFKEGGKALGKGGSESITKLITLIHDKFKTAGRDGILTEFQKEQTEQTQLEFKEALEKLMKKDEDFDQKLKELFVQIELLELVPSSIQQILVDIETKTLEAGSIKQKSQQENSSQTIMKNVKAKKNIKIEGDIIQES